MPEPERALKALSDRLRNGAGGNDHLYRRQVATQKNQKIKIKSKWSCNFEDSN